MRAFQKNVGDYALDDEVWWDLLLIDLPSQHSVAPGVPLKLDSWADPQDGLWADGLANLETRQSKELREQVVWKLGRK